MEEYVKVFRLEVSRPAIYEKLSVDVMFISINSVLTVLDINQCNDILCDKTYVEV